MFMYNLHLFAFSCFAKTAASLQPCSSSVKRLHSSKTFKKRKIVKLSMYQGAEVFFPSSWITENRVLQKPRLVDFPRPGTSSLNFWFYISIFFDFHSKLNHYLQNIHPTIHYVTFSLFEVPIVRDVLKSQNLTMADLMARNETVRIVFFP